MHASQQFTPPQLWEAGHRAEAEGRLDIAAQFYRHLTEHFAFTAEAAEARNGLARIGEAQSPVWGLAAAAHVNGARIYRRRPIAPRDHYRTGRALAFLARLFGWLTVVCGLAAPALYFGLARFMQDISLPRLGPPQILAAAAALVGAGLFVVFAGQMARAVFDQANAIRDLVALERAKFGGD